MGISSLFDKCCVKKKSYFLLLQEKIKKTSDSNFEFNIDYAMYRKNFKSIKGEFECMDSPNYSWLSFILEKLSEGQNLSWNWKQSLHNFIENKIFFNQYLYQNEIFYREIKLNEPKIKRDKSQKKQTSIQSEPVLFALDANELRSYSDDKNSWYIKNYDESNSMRFSLNSSLNNDDNEEFNYNLTMDKGENESIFNNSEYMNKYNSYILKKYIGMIRKQIIKPEHPINIIIKQFIKSFENRLKVIIDFCNNKPNDEKTCLEKGIDVINEVQEFIEIMQVTLKLFYVNTINYKYFAGEKDEIINLVSYILFNDKTFYKQMFDLFFYMNIKTIEALEYKFDKNKDITPKKCGIHAKFCLNDETEQYWKKYKIKPKDKNENIDIISTNEDTNLKEKRKLMQCVEKANFEIMSQAGNDDSLVYSKSPTLKNFSAGKNNFVDESFIYYDIIDFDKTYNKKLVNIKDKLLKELEKTILPKLPEYTLDNNIILPDEPYIQAINYLKQINRYRVPLEKLIMISYLSELIIKCVDKYWENRKDELSPNFLNLDADEIMSIYLYIIYKFNLSTIVVHLEFIKYFTTTITKQSIFGYYYSTFQGCLKYVLESEVKD